MAYLDGWVPNRIELAIDYTNCIGASVTWFPIAIIIESGLCGVGNKDVSCIFDELAADANRKKMAVTKADGTTLSTLMLPMLIMTPMLEILLPGLRFGTQITRWFSIWLMMLVVM